MHNIDLNKRIAPHISTAQARKVSPSAFRYGLDIMRENNMQPSIIRAGRANMFLSNVFSNAFVNATNTAVQLYNSDGSVGAALGAGIGANIYNSEKEAFAGMECLQTIEPTEATLYNDLYNEWKILLDQAFEISIRLLLRLSREDRCEPHTCTKQQ